MIALRPATLADVPILEAWDKDPAVIRATSDDPNATTAFESIVWEDEIAAQSDVARYLIAEADGRPIGAMQIIDPHCEPTHYWARSRRTCELSTFGSAPRPTAAKATAPK